MIYRIDKNTIIWSLYFLIKIVYMFLSLFVISQFTQLGDTERYLSASGIDSFDFLIDSTKLMDALGFIFVSFLGETLANIPFVMLSFYGIYYSSKRLNLTRNQLLVLIALLSFPSFGIWTSIASKEAITVFYLGIILGFIFDLIENKEIKDKWLIILAIYLCFIFKPQYMIAISQVIIFVFLSQKLNLKAFNKLMLLVFFIIISLLALYIFRNEINQLSFIMPLHFSLDVSSTRENTIWVNDFDVFWNAPYGMYIALIGLTFLEALSNPLQLVSWFESMVILSFFLIIIIKFLLQTFKGMKLNIYMLGVFLIVFLWILFVHYPFGALNPGSAIRYRSGFYGFLVVLFYFLYLKSYKKAP